MPHRQHFKTSHGLKRVVQLILIRSLQYIIYKWWQYRARVAHMCTFPLHSLMATCWKMCTVVSDNGRPSFWPWRHPMAWMVSIASLLQPPRVSTTWGMNEIPAEWQKLACWSIYFSSSVPSTCPCVEAASSMVSFWRGDIAVMSKVAGLPRFQKKR